MYPPPRVISASSAAAQTGIRVWIVARCGPTAAPKKKNAPYQRYRSRMGIPGSTSHSTPSGSAAKSSQGIHRGRSIAAA